MPNFTVHDSDGSRTHVELEFYHLPQKPSQVLSGDDGNGYLLWMMDGSVQHADLAKNLDEESFVQKGRTEPIAIERIRAWARIACPLEDTSGYGRTR